MTGELSLWAEVNLGAIRRNVSSLLRLLSGGTKLLAVVKANGYGHGDVQVAKAAVEGGASWIGVARVSEGQRLREGGVDQPILLLAEPPPAGVGQAGELNLTASVYSEQSIRSFSEAAAAAGKTVRVHLKIDTGMHRYGVPAETAGELLSLIDGLPAIELEGIWTHFAVAEDVLNPYTKQQFERFTDALEGLGPRAGELTRHMSNSAATMTFSAAHLDLVRCGIAIYGIHPSPDLVDRIELEPAMSFKSRIGQLKRLPAGESISYGQRYTLEREATVATVPAGYADGLNRALTNSGEVLIRGKRYTICGSVTMDHFLVDVGDDPIEVEDEVVMLGRQGSERISAQEIADSLGTIPYEVVCAVSARVPRVYV